MSQKIIQGAWITEVCGHAGGITILRKLVIELSTVVEICVPYPHYFIF